MIRDENGDKCFESHTEAMFLIGEWVSQIRGYLNQLRVEHGIPLPLFPFYRSRLNDLLNVTQRYIAENQRRERFLMEKNRELSDSNLCPRCQQPKEGKG